METLWDTGYQVVIVGEELSGGKVTGDVTMEYYEYSYSSPSSGYLYGSSNETWSGTLVESDCKTPGYLEIELTEVEFSGVSYWGYADLGGTLTLGQ